MNTANTKHIMIILSVIVFAIPLRAQDLIVTNEGDSLNCKITKVKSDNIYFTFKYKDEIRNTLLPVNQIDYYQMNYYSTAEVSASKVRNIEIFPHFQIALSGGWSYRTARLASNIPSDFKDYYQKLKSGFHYDVGLSYYFTEQLGVGLKYNEYLSKKELGNVYITYTDGSTEYGNMSDNIRVKFIGPTFNYRYFNTTKRNCFLMGIGIGYMDYRDKGFLVSSPVTIKGGTVGTYLSFGYDFGISENLALGFQLTFSSGTLSRITTSDGTSTQTVNLDNDQRENLSRIDLSIGLRFNK